MVTASYIVLGLAVFGLLIAAGIGVVRLGVEFTTSEMISDMLQLADVNENDLVYDLGCGDGRIVIAAAKYRGARGVGIELNPKLIARANAKAKAAGVEHLVRFEVGSFFDIDFSDATVVMLYLPGDIKLRLRPYIWKQLKVGARLVSHDNQMKPDWPPEKSVASGLKGIFMWTITEEQKKAVANWKPSPRSAATTE